MTADGALTSWYEPRPAWFDLALCAPVDGAVDPSYVDLFFPGLNDAEDSGRYGIDTFRQVELDAKAVCAACPVRADCLEYGLAEPAGIWGGRTARERRYIRRRLRPVTAETDA